MRRITKEVGVHCYLTCLYFLLLPLTIAVNTSGSSFLKLASIPIGLYFLFTFIFTKQKLHINIVHLLLLLYTFTTPLTLFVSADAASISFVIGYFLNAMLYVCLSVVKYNQAELRLLENVQVALLLIITVWTLSAGGMDNDRTTLSVFGQTSDPNYFVGFFIFPFAVTLKKIAESKYRILYFLLIIASCYAIFLSGSRGGFLAILVTIAAFAVLYPKTIKNKILTLVVGVTALFIVLLIVWPLLPDIIVKRLTVESVVETGGTGRVDIWKSMLAEIVNSPNKLILGRGINALHPMLKNGRYGSAGAHNQLLQVLYNQGLIGLLTFVALVLGCFIRCIKKRSVVSVAVLGMMALSISLSFNQTTRTFWNLVAYAAFAFPKEETMDTADAANDGGSKIDE